jgi:hypothetical protein
MLKERYGVNDEVVDDEYNEPNAHGRPDVEESEPAPSKPTSYPLYPAVKNSGL